jgi:hypothetical protein
MGQNGFSKMIELSVNAAKLLVNSAELSANATEFQFFGRLLFFHTSNVIQPNFSEFHQVFSNFPKIDGICHL